MNEEQKKKKNEKFKESYIDKSPATIWSLDLGQTHLQTAINKSTLNSEAALSQDPPYPKTPPSPIPFSSKKILFFLILIFFYVLNFLTPKRD